MLASVGFFRRAKSSPSSESELPQAQWEHWFGEAAERRRRARFRHLAIFFGVLLAAVVLTIAITYGSVTVPSSLRFCIATVGMISLIGFVFHGAILLSNWFWKFADHPPSHDRRLPGRNPLMDGQKDLHRIACNYAQDTKTASRGSLAFVIQPNGGERHERLYLLSRSRSGRWIKKWESIRVLTNFRAKTIPPESPLYPKLKNACEDTALASIQETAKGIGQ